MANKKSKRKRQSQSQNKTILSMARQNPEQIQDLFPDIDHIYAGGRTLLTLAIENGEHLSVIEDIIKSGANVNKQNSKGQTALMIAARAQRNDVLQTLVLSGAKVDLFNEKKCTALSISISEKNTDGVKLLVDLGADKSLKTGKRHETALELARRLDKTTAIDYLKHNNNICLSPPFSFVVEITQQIERITTAANKSLQFHQNFFLQITRSKNYCRIVSFEFFLKAAHVFHGYGNVNFQDSSGRTLLMHAAMQNSTRSLSYILNFNPDVNIRDNDGRTALYVFISKMEIPTIILNQLMGDSPCVQDNCRKTALMYAFTNKYNLTLNIVERLNDVRNVSLYHDVHDNDGKTHLMYAIINIPNPDSDILKVLIDRQINRQDKDGMTALMYAIYNHKDIILHLPNCGADRNLQNNEGKTAYMLALENRMNLSNDLLRYLLNDAVNQQDIHGRTALMYAIEHCQSESESLSHIFELSPDVNIRDNNGRTALMHVFMLRVNISTHSLHQLIGDSPSVQDNCGKTALMYAFSNKFNISLDVVRQLHGEILVDADGKTHLMYAIENIPKPNPEILKVLITNQINIQDRSGRSALMYAVLYNEDFISFLLDSGADRNIQDSEGKTAFMLALEHKLKLPLTLFKNLIGEFIDIQDRYGRTALMYAIQHCPLESKSLRHILPLSPDVNIFYNNGRMYAVLCNKDLILFLLDSGADKNIQDREGKTACMLALEKTLKLPLYLFKNLIGEIIDIQDVYGRTVLMYAVEHFHSNELIEYILSLGADVGLQDKYGLTALMISFIISSNLWYSTLDKLSSKNINIQDRLGKSALMYATRYKASKECLRKLMCSGADLNLQDKCGKTALMDLICDEQTECQVPHSNRRYIYNGIYPHHSNCRFQCILTVLENSFHTTLNKTNFKAISKCLKNHSNFHLNWAIRENKTFLQVLWHNGLFLKPNAVENNFEETSPLLVALELEHLDVAKFMVLNNYMITKDFYFLTSFRHRDINDEIKKFANLCITQPWSLFKLSLITISTCVGLYDDRSERVEQLPIPPIMKNRLLFRSSDAKTRVNDWCKITLFEKLKKFSSNTH